MPFLFDFGLSQEDPLSEQRILDIRPGDRILSLASAGEVALTLFSLNDGIHLEAVDISEPQIKLCRLKLAAALHLSFPDNGKFLGYANMEEELRRKLYLVNLRPSLTDDDKLFWDNNLPFIEKGVINAGRFEQYIRKLKSLATLFIGTRNLRRLIECRTLEEQNRIFDDHIATRKILRMIFRIAFHPYIYRKRGLQEQALIHADQTTGERFYSKFRSFCTANLASENYFLQYFLTGGCATDQALPSYLKPSGSEIIRKNAANIEFASVSFQEALRKRPEGYYNKIHLSNLGDWLSQDDFSELLSLIITCCNKGTVICYRYLQKNHFAGTESRNLIIDNSLREVVEKQDRFPFYGILKVIAEAREDCQ